jgi:hypothetical protein
VLQVRAILIDEIPNDINRVGLGPSEPVLNRRLHVEDGPTVKLGRVHLANLILRAMLTTVDGSNQHSVRVQAIAENLARVSKLEYALTDLGDGAVDLIEKEEDSAGTSVREPVGSAERSDVTVSLRKTHEVALGHLRRSAFDNWQTQGLGNLIDKLRLANAMTTTKHKRLLDREDVGCN